FPLEAVNEYYKQLVPNGEVTLPGSTCESCDPKELSPANTWTPQNLATLVEQLGGAVVVTHSQGARPSESPQRTRHARGIVLAAEQRTDSGGLRQRRLHGAQGRLHSDERDM